MRLKINKNVFLIILIFLICQGFACKQKSKKPSELSKDVMKKIDSFDNEMRKLSKRLKKCKNDDECILASDYYCASGLCGQCGKVKPTKPAVSININYVEQFSKLSKAQAELVCENMECRKCGSKNKDVAFNELIVAKTPESCKEFLIETTAKEAGCILNTCEVKYYHPSEIRKKDVSYLECLLERYKNKTGKGRIDDINHLLEKISYKKFNDHKSWEKWLNENKKHFLKKGIEKMKALRYSNMPY